MKLSLIRVYQAVYVPGKNKPLTTIMPKEMPGLEMSFEGGLAKLTIPGKETRYIPTPNIMWMDEMPESPATKAKAAK
jgi:hypothetical protein